MNAFGRLLEDFDIWTLTPRFASESCVFPPECFHETL